MDYSVLFIDDEEKILQSLRRLFRTSEYSVFFLSSGKEGLDFLRKNPVSLIVSDMKMPEMDGVEFLEEAMVICPEAIRIILSGYSEADKIMHAINKGNIWRFIPKPWNNDEIRVTVKNAIDLFRRNREKTELTERLRQKTEELDSLNKLLEKKVEERTWHLNERTRLLNMMLEDVELENIVSQIGISISKILNGSEVFIHSLSLGKIFSPGKTEPAELPKDLIRLENVLIETGGSISNRDYEAILLRKSKKKLGTLLIKKSGISGEVKVEELIEGFTSLLEIVLFQSNLINSAPVLIKDIDKIIGSI